MIRLHGDLDLAVADQIAGYVQQVLTAGGITTLTMNLSGMQFCDSSGMTALVHARDACTQSGTMFLLADVSPQFAKLLTITGLDRHFDQR